jgi:hypothetical protein
MAENINFYFDDQLFETLSKTYLYLNNNTTRCPMCNRFIENISPITLFHSYCCYKSIYDIKQLENEILCITYYLNHYNRKCILTHIDNINSLKHNYSKEVIEYLDQYLVKINRKINNISAY